MQNERAFTIIELLVVISIIGVLSSLMITSFSTYRQSAGYVAAEAIVSHGRRAAAASTTEADKLPPAVNLVSQTAPGQILDPNAFLYLPGLTVSRNLKVQVSFDPDCLGPDCIAEYIRGDSCLSPEYASWSRFGDGVELFLQNVEGANCQE